MNTPEQEDWLNSRSGNHPMRTNREVLLRSLSDHREIMLVIWDEFSDMFSFPRKYCHYVHALGWDYDLDTKRLREITLEVLSGIDLKEEDFL